MKQPAIYESSKLARYYDALYSHKDYQKEAAVIRRVIKQYKKSRGKSLLEVACGSGQHLIHLSKHLDCTGIDLNPGILATARKNVAGVKFHRGDMATFKLNRQFDIITCLFSSIGYVKTLPKLRQTFRNFERHLKPGGVVIVEPWIQPGDYKDSYVNVTPFEHEGVVGARLMRSQKKGRLSILDAKYLISENQGPAKEYQDRHTMGLFTIDEQLRAMRQLGLKSRFVKDGLILFKKTAQPRYPVESRGLLIGVKA